MKRSLLVLAVAAVMGAASAAPAQALGPASLAIAPDAPVTQTSAARERRLLIMRNIMEAQRRQHYGYGGGRRGYGYGGGPRGYGYGPPPRHRHHHHHRGW